MLFEIRLLLPVDMQHSTAYNNGEILITFSNQSIENEQIFLFFEGFLYLSILHKTDKNRRIMEKSASVFHTFRIAKPPNV